MRYQQHGNYHLWIEDKTLFAEVTGSWNKETALSFENDFKKLASSLSGDWAHLVYLDDWDLCTPDVFSIIESLVSWCIENGLKRAANVYFGSSLKDAIVNKMIVQKEGEFLRAVFDNPKDAVTWLTMEGFPTRIKSA